MATVASCSAMLSWGGLDRIVWVELDSSGRLRGEARRAVAGEGQERGKNGEQVGCGIAVHSYDAGSGHVKRRVAADTC